jgi:sugar phosphate isomerase/epimerase
MKNAAYARKEEYVLSTMVFRRIELREGLMQMYLHGYHSVELFADTVHLDPRLGIDRSLIKGWLKEFKINAHSVHGAFRGFRSIRETIPVLKKTIDDCVVFSVPILVIHGVDKTEYNHTRDELDMVRNCLGEIVLYGKDRGVTVALENLRNSGKEDEISWNLEDHVRNFSGTGIKYCLDIGHAAINKADIYREIDAAGEDLVTFHIHNNDGIGDFHNLPDQGIIDWSGVYNYICSRGYAGQFVLEINDREPYAMIEKIDQLFV